MSDYVGIKIYFQWDDIGSVCRLFLSFSAYSPFGYNWKKGSLGGQWASEIVPDLCEDWQKWFRPDVGG